MVISWNKSVSDHRPEEIDYMSSPTTIYLHRNVVEKERDGITFYEYEEAKLTPAEFSIYTAAKSTEAQLTIMEALADLYELTAM